MASTYSCSSFAGFVSSNLRFTGALYFSPRPKLIPMALVWPICKYPFDFSLQLKKFKPVRIYLLKIKCFGSNKS